MSDIKERNFEALREEISSRYNELSKKLRDIAKFALDHPTDMAIETIAVIAKKSNVQPSAIIRFAKAFGYSGFSEMQKAFQSRVVERSASYKERVRSVTESFSFGEENAQQSLLDKFCNANIIALQELQKNISEESLESAANLLKSADNIYIMGQRRSFPIATYLNYVFNHANHRAHMLSSLGGMLFEVADNMRENDVLVAISYPPYSPETVKVAEIAAKKNVPLIVITDSDLSPITASAKIFFEVEDGEVHTFRSLSSSMCLAQALGTLLAFKSD